ncbi:hypothetical protein AA0Z99_04780 [Agrococcus sp. 1P02AA]|uniref:hypothetical protein n=1 Tax=Agrococcus sp. 1P02AA TaxID=3132259 RepID=UPI0039A6A411
MDSPHGFTVSAGLDRGYTAAELRSMAFTSPARGVRITAAIGDDARALFEAVRVLAVDDQFFSHTTAARIHGMPLPTRFETEATIHLASPTGRARMQRPGVIGHRLQSESLEIDGMRVETRSDAFIHLATMLTLEELVVVGDWLVSPNRRAPLSIEELVDALRRYDGARGLHRARHALSLVRVGAESPRETLVRLLVVRSLPEPTLQHRVLDASGAFIARLDLSWPSLKLGVEYDGEHHAEPRQRALDEARLEKLRAAGWRIITVTKEHLADGGVRLLAEIVAAHRRAAAWTAA